MSKLPIVAIIGRPNTGKSTLFNRLARKRLAIESEVPGTTRDHVASVVRTPEMEYLLLDTGGMGGGTDDADFEDDVHGQSVLALQAADVILFIVDGKMDPVRSDFTVAETLRKKRKRHVPVLLVINKCDNDDARERAEHAFHKLGISDEIFPVSAAHKIGTPELEEAIIEHLIALKFKKPETRNEKQEIEQPRIAIIGKPNVGKSSIINALMSDTQRSTSPKLVSDIPGTTRDATDTIVRHEEKEYVLVDTAGLRRQAKVEYGIESLSMLRSIQAIEECDIAVLALDASEPVSKQDKRIASMAVDSGKGLIILLNKIDLLTTEEKQDRMLDVARSFLFCRYAPVLPCSAKTRTGLLKLFDLATMVQGNRLRRIPPKELLRFIRDAVAGQPMSALASAKFVTQGKDPPPTFILFVKNPKLVQLSQLRFIENRLRQTFGLEGTPVRLITKGPRDRKYEMENSK